MMVREEIDDWDTDIDLTAAAVIGSVFENLCDEDKTISVNSLQTAFLDLAAKSDITGARFMITQVDKYLQSRIHEQTSWIDSEGAQAASNPMVSVRAASAFQLATAPLRSAIWSADLRGGLKPSSGGLDAIDHMNTPEGLFVFHDEILDEQTWLGGQPAEDRASETRRKCPLCRQ